MSLCAAHLKIIGKVQGVWYRASTQDEAVRLGLTGWVANMPDGSVEAHAEGDKSVIETFVKWCHEGPPLACVDKVAVQWIEPTGKFSEFGVQYF